MSDASVVDAGEPEPEPVAEVDGDGGADAALEDAGGEEPSPPAVPPGPAKYMLAYGTFFPTDVSRDYLADVGGALFSPQTLGVTVPAGGTVDVVVYAIDNAPGGVDSYALSCSTQ